MLRLLNRAANKAEKAATRPVTPGQAESDEDDGIVIPSTPPRFAGESQGGYHYYLGYKDARTPAAASRAHSCPRIISGSTPRTYRAPCVYGPRKDGTRALEKAPCDQQTVYKQST